MLYAHTLIHKPIHTHIQGIMIASEKYEALLKSVDRDCKVLQSFGIMDYSLLLGVFNLDQAQRERTEVHTKSCLS